MNHDLDITDLFVDQLSYRLICRQELQVIIKSWFPTDARAQVLSQNLACDKWWNDYLSYEGRFCGWYSISIILSFYLGFRAPSVSIGKNLPAIISLITVNPSDFVGALAMLAPSPVSPIPLSIVIISFCSHSVQLVSLKTKIMSMMIDLVCNFLVSEHVEQLGLNVARS